MKKIIFLLTILAFVASAIAQNSKKTIALLEPLVGEGSTKVDGVEKAMVRGEMRKAICVIDGFNAVTRTDIDQLMKEHGFQYSGMVSDEQRKQIGKMRAGDYICVSKITKSNTQFYLEAYLIDVESGDISNPASQRGTLVNGECNNLYSLCQALAKELTWPFLKATAEMQRKLAIKDSLIKLGYVDLGLPSGTLWKNKNEGFCTESYVKKYYVNRGLLSWDDFLELKSNCTWAWTGRGYKVIGTNGNYIILPAEGRETTHYFKNKKGKVIGSYTGNSNGDNWKELEYWTSSINEEFGTLKRFRMTNESSSDWWEFRTPGKNSEYYNNQKCSVRLVYKIN